MDDVALSKKGDNYSWEKMHDLTLSEYTVIHQHFPAFLPACFESHSSVPFPFAPKVRPPNWRSWGLGRTAKFKESPWFVEVLLVNNLEAQSLLTARVSQELNVIFVSFPHFILSQKGCVLTSLKKKPLWSWGKRYGNNIWKCIYKQEESAKNIITSRLSYNFKLWHLQKPWSAISPSPSYEKAS